MERKPLGDSQEEIGFCFFLKRPKCHGSNGLPGSYMEQVLVGQPSPTALR